LPEASGVPPARSELSCKRRAAGRVWGCPGPDGRGGGERKRELRRRQLAPPKRCPYSAPSPEAGCLPHVSRARRPARRRPPKGRNRGPWLRAVPPRRSGQWPSSATQTCPRSQSVLPPAGKDDVKKTRAHPVRNFCIGRSPSRTHSLRVPHSGRQRSRSTLTFRRQSATCLRRPHLRDDDETESALLKKRAPSCW
jgi:hypothetical protein